MSRVFEKEQQPDMNNKVEGIRIRHARSADFSAIIALLEQLWPERILNREKFLDIFRKDLDSDFHRLKAHKFYAKLGLEKTGYIFMKKLS